MTLRRPPYSIRLSIFLTLFGVAATASAETYDHRRVQSPVKDQGAGGTCTAFAVNAALETLPGFPHDLSEQFLYGVAKLTQEETTLPGSEPARRPSMDEGLLLSDYVRTLETYGITYEELLPYNRRQPVISKDLEKYLPAGDRGEIARALYQSTLLSKEQREKLWSLGKYKATGLELVDYFAVRDGETGAELTAGIAAANKKLRDYLSVGGLGRFAVPASYVIHKDVWSGFLNKPDIPVITLAHYPFDAKDKGGHAVTIVGFTTDIHTYAPSAPAHLKSDGFWIIKNSWGTKWGGLGGYGLVSYAYHDLCVDEALLIGRYGVAEFPTNISWYDNRLLTTSGDFRLKVQPIRRWKDVPGGGARQLVDESLFLSTCLHEPSEANLTTVKYIVDYRSGSAAPDGAITWGPTARIVSPRLQVRRGKAPDRSFRFRPWNDEFSRALEQIVLPPLDVETRLELNVVSILYEREPNFLNVVRGGRRYRTVIEGGRLQSRELLPASPGGILDLATAEKLLAEAEGL